MPGPGPEPPGLHRRREDRKTDGCTRVRTQAAKLLEGLRITDYGGMRTAVEISNFSVSVCDRKEAMTPRIRIDTDEVMTVADAARALKISRQAAWDAVGNGRLKTIEVAGVTFVTRKSVDDYRKTRRPGGPKPKKPRTTK